MPENLVCQICGIDVYDELERYNSETCWVHVDHRMDILHEANPYRNPKTKVRF